MSNIIKCQQCGKEFEAKRSDACYCKECQIITRQKRQTQYEYHSRESCPECGKPMVRRAKLCRECNNKHQSWRELGEKNANWKGGKFTKADGYIYIRVKRTSDGAGQSYKAEHHLVWEASHGRLPKGWIVHHLNGIRDDNRLVNLVAMPRKRHSPMLLVKPYQDRIRQLEEQLNLPPT